VTRNLVVPRLSGARPLDITTKATTLQQKAFGLMGV